MDLAPQSAEARNNLALMLVKARRLVEAREHYEAALRVAKEPIPALLANLAELDVIERRYDDAQARYLQALDLDPGQPGARLGLARLLTKKTGVNAATAKVRRDILALEETVAKDWRNGPAQKRLGLLLGVSGREKEALHSLDTARRLLPDDPEIYNNMGAIWARQGETRKAVAALMKALQLKPDYTEAKKNLEYVEQKATSNPH